MTMCTNCVMDTTDPQLTFDAEGVCNYCRYIQSYKLYWRPESSEAAAELDQLVNKIKKEQANQPYDAIIGLSGGIDSSYMAHWAVKKANLRLLAVHIDAGWNSELAVQNIEKIVKGLNIDLHTHVVDWEIMRDVHIAFLKSGVANQDVPQDHAFFAALYSFAVKNNIKYVLNGTNTATESVLPSAWEHDALDADQIKDICRKFGVKNLKKYPLVSFSKLNIYFPRIKKMQVIYPLNYMPYNKKIATEVLEKELGWKSYGAKHCESRFTKFFQSYWLPVKFGYDKRKAHLTSLILSEQITREEALKELEKLPYDPATINNDIQFIIKKLEISMETFQGFLQGQNGHYTNYKHNTWKKKLLRQYDMRFNQLQQKIASIKRYSKHLFSYNSYKNLFRGH